MDPNLRDFAYRAAVLDDGDMTKFNGTVTRMEEMLKAAERDNDYFENVRLIKALCGTRKLFMLNRSDHERCGSGGDRGMGEPMGAYTCVVGEDGSGNLSELCRFAHQRSSGGWMGVRT